MSTEMRYEIRNEEIEHELRDLANSIDNKLPNNWGFTLLLYEFTPGDSLFYISNAQRADMLKAMQEFIRRQTQ